MDVEKYLIRAVINKEISLVKAVVLSQLNSDREMAEFESIFSCKYAEKELKKDCIQLFIEDNGETAFIDNNENWDKELWQIMRIEFEYNFSKLKFERIIAIMNHLRSQGHPDFVVNESKQGLENKTQREGGEQVSEGKNYRNREMDSEIPKGSNATSKRNIKITFIIISFLFGVLGFVALLSK